MDPTPHLPQPQTDTPDSTQKTVVPQANLSVPAVTANTTPAPDLSSGDSIPTVPPPLAAPAAIDTVTTQAHPESPAEADDNDLIEQEWVNKAKAIVESTHDDPYLQNKEINKFKADYIKKRYKRDIKVHEA